MIMGFSIFMLIMAALFWPIVIDMYKKLRKEEKVSLHLLYLCVMSVLTMMVLLWGSLIWRVE